MHNVTNWCALFDVGVDATCTSNAVHKVPTITTKTRKISLCNKSPMLTCKIVTFANFEIKADVVLARTQNYTVAAVDADVNLWAQHGESVE